MNTMPEMPEPERTDEEVAALVQKGDIDSFRILVERYDPKLTRYAKRFFFHGDDGKDIVQEVFIKAYVNIKSFDTARRFSPWIYRIAHNEFVNNIKKRQKELARMEKQRDKFAKRLQRKTEKLAGPPVDDMGEPVGDLSEPKHDLDQEPGAVSMPAE